MNELIRALARHIPYQGVVKIHRGREDQQVLYVGLGQLRDALFPKIRSVVGPYADSKCEIQIDKNNIIFRARGVRIATITTNHDW